MHQMRWISGGAALAAVALTMAGLPAAAAGASGRALAVGRPASPPAARMGEVSAPASGPTNAIDLPSVSCLGPSFCMAAGVAGFFRNHPVTEMWNGKSWRGLATPAPAHALGLSGVSCASRTRCMAVGVSNTAPAFALSWNGRRWHILTVAPGRGTLSGISCPDAASCMAVGHTGAQSAQNVGARAYLWNGRSWRTLRPPAVPGARSARLSSVSCTRPSSCVAVGSYVSNAPGTPQLTLAETWDGTSWRLVPTPAVGSAGDSALSAVSCASASLCFAVGFDNFVRGVSSDAVTERWDGQSWQVFAAAIPAQARFSSLAGVSCNGPAHCIAVGSFVSTVGSEQALAELWTGSSWQLLFAPSPYNDADALAAVSCASANNCTAVGSGTMFGIFPADSLAEHWGGLHWRVHRSGQFDDLFGVSCLSAARCMAVGGYIGQSDLGLTLAQSWNGKRWQQRATPTPAAFDHLSDVSCASRLSCIAVGGGSQGFAQSWNGRHWRTLQIPANGNLTSVSCASATHCLAIGPDTALAWNGRRWRLAPPASVPGAILSDVSCPRANLCIAVGSSQDKEGSLHPLAEEWNGRHWSLLLARLPRLDGQLTAVDCAGPAACIAVGSYFTNANHNLAERWNGSTWQMRTPPGQIRSGPGLLDVSCPSTTRCVAVGHYSQRFASPDVGLTERWNGRAWQQVKPARTGDALTGVSCSAPSHCIAVGHVGNLTRAEKWNGSTWRLLPTRNP